MKPPPNLVLVLLVLAIGYFVPAEAAPLPLVRPTPCETETGEVGGVITDSSGSPIPNAQISVYSGSGSIHTTITATADGGYRFVLPEGDYRLKISSTGFSAQFIDHHVTGCERHTVDITIKDPGAITPTPTPRRTPTPFPTVKPTPKRTPTIYTTPTPEVTPTPTPSPTPDAWSKNDDMMKAFRPDGRMTYDAPTEMTQGDSDDFIVRISAKDIGEKLTDGLKNPSAPEQIRVSPKMKLVLTSPDGAFTVTDQSTPGQLLGDEYSQWKWRIKALKSGQHILNLSVFALLEGDEGKDIPISEKSITINVSYGYMIKTFFSDNWQVLLGSGVLTALLGWLVRWLFTRSPKPPAGKDWEQA